MCKCNDKLNICYSKLGEKQWCYYKGFDKELKEKVCKDFENEDCKNFIQHYFDVAVKSGAFDVNFFNTYKIQGKYAHMVSLYFLGCCFQKLIKNPLEEYFKLYIGRKSYFRYDFSYDFSYDFRYTWFLTCLYHDTASVIEKEEWKVGSPADLNFYLGKHDIQYNVFNHIWDNPFYKPFTYSEDVIKNYFRYRVEYGHSIDHGIIGGYLLYDRLVKNYNNAFKEALKSKKATTYESFEYQNLSWRIEHLSHFAIIADAIIAHNIWRSSGSKETKKLYRDYGLDSLIGNKEKLKKENNPLVFFLGLFDTIEPIKFFGQPDILKEISISNDDKIIIINFLSEIERKDAWVNKIKTLSEWLNVNVDVDVKESESKIEIGIL